MKHTPTPWTIGYEDHFMGHWGPATLCDSTPQPIEMNPENIAHIVRAVNAFEPMREALKAMRLQLLQSNNDSEYAEEAIQMCAAALALADKEQP